MYSGITRTLFLCRSLSKFRHGVSTSSAPYILEHSFCCSRLLKGPSSNMSTSAISQNKEAESEDLDKPIKFTSSQAAQLKAETTLGGDAFPNAPWYQPYVVIFSVSCFLFYFLYYREENDVDELMKVPLWQRVPGLEKQQLNIVLQYNRANNLDTADIERRIKELELEDKQLALNQGQRK